MHRPRCLWLTWRSLACAGWRVKASAKDVELACRVMGRLAEPLGAATESAVLAAFDGFISRQLAGYPSSREQDEQQLQQEGLPW